VNAVPQPIQQSEAQGSVPVDPATLLAAIRAPVREDLAAVDHAIRTELASDVVLVNSIAEYIIGAGGKRLRPLLVVLAARAAGYTGQAHASAAALVEFIHTATLLHDDVVDESSQRRGRDTANEVFGSTASVLVGDFLYSRAFQMMVKLDRMAVMAILADATNTIAAGEVLQLMNLRDPDTTEERYFEVIYRKTARLFEAGGEVAGVLAGATPAVCSALATYGKHLGNAFQLVDDALDYRSDVGEAPLKENLAAGIVMLTGWDRVEPLFDPMCGSGTLLIEAALMALAIPPGARRTFGFEKLNRHDPAKWAAVRETAMARAQAQRPLEIYGSDLSAADVTRARTNLDSAGLTGCLMLQRADVLEVPAPAAAGVLIANPPYGVRIGEATELAAFYPALGNAFKARYAGWRCYVFSADAELAKLIRLKPSKRTPLFNGPLECRLYEYRMIEGSLRRTKPGDVPITDDNNRAT